MAEKYMTTAEFAEFCGVTKNALLWYDRQGVLKPAVRGENGYRYYSSRQFFDLATITMLKQTGNSLREIRTFQKGHSYEKLQTLFEEKSRQLKVQLQELLQMINLVDAVQKNLSLSERYSPNMPELIWQDAEYLATTAIPDGYGWFEQEPEEYVYAHIRSYRGKDGVAQYPLGTMLAEDSLTSPIPKEISYFYQAERDSLPALWEKPAGRYVRIFHQGDYGHITEALKTASDFMQQKELKINGPIYEYDCVTYLVESMEDSLQMLLIPTMPMQ